MLFLPGFLILLVFVNRYFFGLLARSAWQSSNGFRLEPGETKEAFWPTVGVVIPVFNEGSSVYLTIQSLARSDYPKSRFSIWVVDDCSTDDSFHWAQKAALEYPFVKLHRNSTNLGKRLGIAAAVRKMDCEYVVSVDSDVVVESDAVRRLIQGFSHSQVGAVGGRVSVSNSQENWLTRMQTIKYWIGYEFLKNLENSFETVLCLSGCLTAYRRTVLIEVEDILCKRNIFGVPIKYGEDRYLTRQVVKKGYKTKLDLQSRCYTKAPHTLSGYFAQQLRWRRSNIVDFLGGIFHIWKLNPFVALHYYSLYCLLLAYPAVLWSAAVSGNVLEGIALHLGILSCFAAVYSFSTRQEKPQHKVHPLWFLCMAFVLPVTYMVLNVLALLTLDSGSWETRKKPSGKKTELAPNQQ